MKEKQEESLGQEEAYQLEECPWEGYLLEECS